MPRWVAAIWKHAEAIFFVVAVGLCGVGTLAAIELMGVHGDETATAPAGPSLDPTRCHCADCRCENCPERCGTFWRVPLAEERPPAVVFESNARHLLWSWRTNDRGDWVWICTGGPHGKWKRSFTHNASNLTCFANADGEWLFVRGEK